MAHKPLSSNARIRRIMKFLKQQQAYSVSQINMELKEMSIRVTQARRKIESLEQQISRIQNSYKNTVLALQCAAIMLKRVRVRMDFKRSGQCKKDKTGVIGSFALPMSKAEDPPTSGALDCSVTHSAGFVDSNLEEDIAKADILMSQIESFQTELQKLGNHLRSLKLEKLTTTRLAMSQKMIESDLLQEQNAVQQQTQLLASYS
mmetsp:Transcript_9078/g.13950  ORF Transcript_9078/g.13950 Transcript_9078/m.13950 type:complete len:204 (+) Transcript_9078:99-710(+)